MDYYYSKEFGITFQYVEGTTVVTKNTWNDYSLIPKSRPFVPPPSVKTIYLDVPGLNGKLDYTEALMGRPALNNRSGSWDFIFANDILHTIDLIHKLREDLNGKLSNIILDGDPEYFYRGRVQISEVDRPDDGSPLSVTMDFNLGPYKYDIQAMTQPRDPLVKPDYYTSAMRDVYVSGSSETMYIYNNGPLIHVNIYATGSDMSVHVDNRNGSSTHSINTGKNDSLFDLTHGQNTVKVYGHGRFQMYYCEGRL